MTEASPKLDEVREKIDAIDEELLSLIDQRTVLTREVAAAKRAAGGGANFALRPARESQILRKLCSAEKTAVSRKLIVRVWRELIGDSLHAQSPYQIVTWSYRNPAKIAELARARFGGAPGMYNVEQPEQALAGVKAMGGIAELAVTREHAWWGRMLVEPSLSIFAALPEVGHWGAPAALAVAQVTPEPSGPGDETLWVTDSTRANAEIVKQMGEDGVAARFLIEAGGLKLFALTGFYQAEDERLSRAPGDLTGVVGVVPRAFDLT
jgi:chorismate mutase